MRYLAGFGVHAQGSAGVPPAAGPVFLHGDLTRSTMMTTDTSATVLSRVAYTAFGDAVTPDGQGGWRVGFPAALGTRYQYDGGWGYESGAWGPGPDGQGAEGGPLALWGEDTTLPPVTLQHVGWRWYQPGIGRFVQRDPIGLGGGVNAYAYVDNDPTTAADPLGLQRRGPIPSRPKPTPYPHRDTIVGPDTPVDEMDTPVDISDAANAFCVMWGLRLRESRWPPPLVGWCWECGGPCRGHIGARPIPPAPNPQSPSPRPPRPAPEPQPCEPNVLNNFLPADRPGELPPVAFQPEPSAWLHENALQPFLEEIRKERTAEVDRIAEHVELSLTELLQRADEEIGKAQESIDRKEPGAEGRLAQAENRHAELLARRERRRRELQQQRSLTLQAVERIASALVLPHPDRHSPEVRRLQPSAETEAVAMRVVMEYERAQGRQVYDVHEKNLGYDVTSLDINSGELRLIEVKGLADATGTILLTPNERRVAEDRRDCYWLYVVTDCANKPVLQEPVKDPARFPWHEVTKVAHYWLEVNAMTKPMTVREDSPPYGREHPISGKEN